MAAAGANIKDELLPELEMSIIPSKFTDNVKVDLFGFSDAFLNFLIHRGYIPDEISKDTQYMSMAQAIDFCRAARDAYRLFKMQEVTRADI